LSTLTFLNIKNLDSFINEIKKLHLLRRVPENSWGEFAFDESEYVIKPTKEFWEIIKLLETPSSERNTKQLKQEILNKIINAIRFNDCFYLASFTRTITVNLNECSDDDLFLWILFFQLLLVNYFTAADEVVNVQNQKNFKNFFSIIGSQSRDNKYFRKPLYNLNEDFIKRFNVNLDKYGMFSPNITKWESDPLILWGEKERLGDMECELDQYPLEGLKVYLGPNYFHQVFDELKFVITSRRNLQKLQPLYRSWNSSRDNLRVPGRTSLSWFNQVQKWPQTMVGLRNISKLFKTTLGFRYGISRNWSNNQPNPFSGLGLESVLIFSSTFSTQSLSPHFFFSYYRYPKKRDSYYTQNIYAHEKTLSEFVTNFFTSAKVNTSDYYFKNRVLKILSKRSSLYSSLTVEDKSLSLKTYGLDRAVELRIYPVRPPLLFNIEWDDSLPELDTTKILYKQVRITFNWKNFTINIKGPVKKTKMLFFIGSLYWEFNLRCSNYHLITVAGFETTPSTYIFFNYLKEYEDSGMDRDVGKRSLKYLRFDQLLWDEISRKPILKFLELTLEIHPNIFLKVSKMFLTTNDNRMQERGFCQGGFTPTYLLRDYWIRQKFGDSDRFNSWRYK